MRTVTLAAGLTMLLLISGCAAEAGPGQAAPSPVDSLSSEPTPEPTVDSTAKTAVIFGTHIELRNAAGVEVDSIPFESELEAFVSKTEKYFGLAAEEHIDGPCTGIVYGDGSQVAEGDSLELLHRSDSAVVQFRTESSEINGIRIETPNGVSIGEDASDMVASTGPELKREMGTTLNGNPYWSLVYDAVGTWTEHTPDPAAYGAGAWVEDGLLSTIIFPASVGTLYLSCPPPD